MTQVVELLPSKPEALSSNFSTAKNKIKMLSSLKSETLLVPSILENGHSTYSSRMSFPTRGDICPLLYLLSPAQALSSPSEPSGSSGLWKGKLSHCYLSGPRKLQSGCGGQSLL
jgi:hypothetical protein